MPEVVQRIEFDDPITSRSRKLDRIAKRTSGGDIVTLAGPPMSDVAEAETLRRTGEGFAAAVRVPSSA